MNGIILVDKPKDWTSHDVVAKVRGLLKKQGIAKPKVGHAGTLDPLATGLLIILIGNYTKRAQEFSKLDKIYKVSMKLGQTSTTGDAEGVKSDISGRKPTKKEIENSLKSFVGEIKQIPPAYSAIKVNGQRAYKLARAGKSVALKPRKVTVYRLQLTDYKYPEVRFNCEVSSGTYIRSLVEDIGQKLGTGAYMSDLQRTQIGKYSIEQTHKIENLVLDEELKILG